MSILLEDKYKNLVEKTLNSRLNEISISKTERRKEIVILEEEEKEIYQLFAQLNKDLLSQENINKIQLSDVNNSDNNLNGYPSKASWSKKAAYILRKENKPLSTREVADILFNKYETEMERKAIVPKVSVALTTTKIFKRITNREGEFQYSLS